MRGGGGNQPSAGPRGRVCRYVMTTSGQVLERWCSFRQAEINRINIMAADTQATPR